MSDSGFDLLGAEMPKVPASGLSFSRSAVAFGAGAVGAFVFRKHPVLAFLDAAALASNVHAVHQGDRSWKDAVRRMGRHVVATAGSLALPAFPAIGYVAGAVAADLLIDGNGGGIIEEFARYENITDSEVGDDRDIIDAEIVTDNTKALVKK